MFIQGFIPFNNCCCRPMMPAYTPFMPVFACNSVFMPQVQVVTPYVNPFGFYNIFQNLFQNMWNIRQNAPKQNYSFLNLTRNNNSAVQTPKPAVKPTVTKATVSKPARKNNTTQIDNKPITPKTKSATNSSRVSGNNLPTLAEVDYDAQKANKLVQDAMSHRRTTPLRKGETGRCAAYVKEAIQRTGLGEYVSGHAYQCGDIMAQNDNFQEIKVSGKDLKNLPAGCVVVYPQNDVYNRTYGHILITKGDGSSISQFASNTTKASDNARVFVPV